MKITLKASNSSSFNQKLLLIKYLKEIAALSLMEAVELVDNFQNELATSLSVVNAEKWNNEVRSFLQSYDISWAESNADASLVLTGFSGNFHCELDLRLLLHEYAKISSWEALNLIEDLRKGKPFTLALRPDQIQTCKEKLDKLEVAYQTEADEDVPDLAQMPESSLSFLELEMRCKRYANGTLMPISQLIETVKFFKYGSNEKLSLREAKDLLDALREGKTIRMTWTNMRMWGEFVDFLKREPIDCRQLETELQLTAFSGNAATETKLKKLLMECLQVSEIQAQSAIDGLQFGKAIALRLPPEKLINIQQKLNLWEVVYIGNAVPQQQSDTETPHRDQTYPPAPSVVQCRLACAGNITDKIALIRVLRQFSSEEWSLLQSKRAADDLWAKKNVHYAVLVENLAAFRQEIANFGVTVIY